jgi:hypothetical protein
LAGAEIASGSTATVSKEKRQQEASSEAILRRRTFVFIRAASWGLVGEHGL